MISTDGGVAAQLVPLDASVFECFDDLEDTPGKPIKRETTGAVFDDTGYGSDTSTDDDKTTPAKRSVEKKKIDRPPKTLAWCASRQRHIDLLTRPYEPSDFDKDTMTFWHSSDFNMKTMTVERNLLRWDPRPLWTPPQATNDNQKGKHSFRH